MKHLIARVLAWLIPPIDCPARCRTHRARWLAYREDRKGRPGFRPTPR